MCPEIAGANGQGETVEHAKESLKAAIELILADRREDMLRGLPTDAIQATVTVE
jgi:predicted RNase H-like HicB family nuclease